MRLGLVQVATAFFFFCFFEAVRWARFVGPWKVSWAPSTRDWPKWPGQFFSFFFLISFLFKFKFEFEFKFKSDFDQLVKQGHPIYDVGGTLSY